MTLIDKIMFSVLCKTIGHWVYAVDESSMMARCHRCRFGLNITFDFDGKVLVLDEFVITQTD